MATHFDYDCGNGIIWRIPLEDEKIEKRKIRVRRPDLSEAQEAVQIMRDFYAAKGIPVPQWEEEFGQKMIEGEGAPPPPEVPSSSESEKEEAIPPMPAYGTQEFFVWCKKTKKAREAKKEAAKASALAEKEAAKAAKEAAKEAKKKKVAEPKPKIKPRIKVKDAPV
uniref:Uncharacterized protein n=1 Tax=viral metagenome TaxID=1070528 RepID=A0A6C0BKJ1_9ZZZZ